MATLVKLGGAVLTDKATPNVFRPETAHRLLSEMAAALAAAPDLASLASRRSSPPGGPGPLVLLSGAGSFGHPQASHLARQAPGSHAARLAAAATFASLADLEAHVMACARDAALPVVPMALAELGELRRGAFRATRLERLHSLMAAGYVPYLHGSLLGDPWQVVGADEVAAALAGQRRFDRLLFVTDVDGVYDRPPGQPGARLLAQVTPRSAPAGLVAVGTVDPRRAAGAAGRGTDVTGRMAGKLQWAFTAARDVETLVLNGNAPGRLRAALEGRPVVATQVMPK